jgi:hypothetical protein
MNRPAVETLEGKALLSGGLGLPSGLEGSLSAVETRTPKGIQVTVTLTETNVTNHDIELALGPDSTDFVATRGGKPVWDTRLGIHPQIVVLETLKAHQSVTRSNIWDGRSNLVDPSDPWKEGPPLTGTFTITSEYDRTAKGISVTLGGDSTTKSTHVTPPKPPVHHSH